MNDQPDDTKLPSTPPFSEQNPQTTMLGDGVRARKTTPGYVLERLKSDDTWEAFDTGSGGDVVGPGSSTDGNLAVFDGTTGKLIKDGGAPNGGSGLVQTATVTLTDDQIKALPTLGVQTVAAQGANTVIIPVSAIIITDTSAGQYTASGGDDIGDASFTLMIGADYISTPLKGANALTATALLLSQFSIPQTAPGATTFDGIIISDSGSTIQIGNVTNLPLKIKDDWAGLSNYSGGNAANTMKVIVYYVVVST